MELTRERALKTISDGIAWVVAQARVRAAIHLFDSNTVIQELFRRLLSEIYDLNRS